MKTYLTRKSSCVNARGILPAAWPQQFLAIPGVGEGGGSLDKKNFFFPVWTCIKPNLVSKNFPFTGGGGPSTKIFFFQSEHVSSQIWCQKIFPLLGGGSLDKKFFFPVWTCIKPILVSKNFPFTRGGGPSTKNFFFQSQHVSSQIWCQKIFPLLGGGVPRQKFFFPVWTCIKPNLVSKNFPFTETGTPPPQKVWTDTQTGVKTLPSFVLRTRAVTRRFLSQLSCSVDASVF